MDLQSLQSSVCPPLDLSLVEQLVTEFLDVERRYFLGDWEPATLNGGQFAEVAARIIYHIDSGNLNARKPLSDCLRYVEDTDNNNSHSFPQRRSALHLCRVLRTLYKFRSQRGAVHIDPDYTANQLDSQFVVSMVRWTMSEILRLFGTSDRAAIVRMIKEIVKYEVPAILSVDGRSLVQRTDCTIEEEILLLLNKSGDEGMTSSELIASIPRAPASVRSAISRMSSAGKREIFRKQSGELILVGNGLRRIREELAPKLSVE